MELNESAMIDPDAVGHDSVYVPVWQATPFGRLSSGLFWEAHRACLRHRRLARVWMWLHYLLGIAGVTLAAVSGFGGLTEVLGVTQAATIAILSAVASGLATFLKTDEKRREHLVLAAAWDNLRDDISVVYETRPPGPSDADPASWREVVDALQAIARALRASNAEHGAKPPPWPSAGPEPA
ncbi:hypothetical protein [Actinoplanes sp. L3-i22]|uniref:hypothetical protein n=1 Tax=Actinoplanes sp. L3-i22 TaxID=2836373 RepID=UPI001C77E906|nr:hypothetical protein [Actinoplanes sp. L3-i22]BCY11687.1 hypothetical protein L3i22_067750 [Actinoplanes sp. L3-i22]